MNKLAQIAMAGAMVLLVGCYSFKDASVDPNLKSFSVELFPNHSENTNPLLSQQFTEALKDKILNESNLNFLNAQADVHFTGSITRYEVTAIAPQAGETSALNRLTIGVRVKLENELNEKESWESGFSRFADFDSRLNFASVETDLVDEIIRQLTDDIFRRAFVNW